MDMMEASEAAEFEAFRMIRVPILPQDAGMPLLEVLRAHVDEATLAPILAHGGLWLKRERVRDLAQPAPVGETLLLHRPPTSHYSTPQIGSDDICYADEYLLALNKHVGWYTTPTPWDRKGHVRESLKGWLAQQGEDDPYVHLLHRLDRDTSGVLLCSRDPAINPIMQQHFDRGAVLKEYLCLCSGTPPHATFALHTGHGRGRAGQWRLYDLAQVGRTLPNGSRVKVAYTSFTVLHQTAQATLLRATLYTGRTHQIRLHLAAVGLPLVGDTRYGGVGELAGQPITAHCLHAWRVSLPHPAWATPLVIRAPLPAWLGLIQGKQKAD